MALEVERDGDVLVARWCDGENRLNPASLDALESLCERVENETGPLALVVTGDAKFFSNGLDLDRFAAHPEELGPTAGRLQVLLGRLLVLPCYTVAAINGHAFAGGAMLTCGFDHRVMREDRGYWCLNEVEIGLPLSAQMGAAVLGRLPRATALEAMLTARRYGGAEALAAGIADEIAAEDRVLPASIERAAAVATKNRTIVTMHKRLAFAQVAASCGWDLDQHAR